MIARWIIKSTEDCMKQILNFYAMVINKNLKAYHGFMTRSNASFDNETMP